MILFISFAILIALAYANYLITKNLLHPSVVFVSIWCVQLLGLLIFRSRFIEPSVAVLLIVVLGAFLFSIGAHLTSINRLHQWTVFRPRKVRRHLALFWVVAVVVSVCLYGQFRIFTDLTYGYELSAGLVYVRTLGVSENDDIYGLFKYGNALALGVLLLLQILIIRSEADLLHKFLFVYILGALLMMSVLSTGRGPIAFVFLLLGVAYVFGSGKEKINRRTVGISAGLAVLTFLVFWIMGRSMGKAEEDPVGAMYGLIDYVFSSIPALSVYLDQNPIKWIGGDWGQNSFRFFAALAAKIGMGEKPPNLVQEFVPVPHFTNLYTMYLQYIRDFGWLGIIAMPPLLGYLHGALFRWAMKNRSNEFASYILVASYLPLLQSSFQETHLSLISSWIQLSLIGIVMTKSFTQRIKIASNG